MKKTFRLGNDRHAERILLYLQAEIDTFRGWSEFLGGMGYQLTLEQIKPKQTDSQRGMYWASLHEFGKHLGYDARETEAILHNHILCCAYGVKETREIGGSRIEIPNERSSKQNREDYAHLIDTLMRVAAEEGFYIEPSRSH